MRKYYYINMISTEKIKEITQKIRLNFNPKKIILFGSYASDSQNVDSDLDLLIVKESNLPKHRRANDIRKALIGSMVPMDILVYTPEEFETEKSQKFSFLNSALKTAKILYDQPN